MAEEQLDTWRMDGKASMLWTWRVTPGHTGRTIQGDGGSALAADWAKLSNRDEMIAHPACQKFRDEVSESRLVPGISLLCFRRRDFGNVRPTWDSMGPPPDCDAKGGRYNKPGHAVLYLCD